MFSKEQIAGALFSGFTVRVASMGLAIYLAYQVLGYVLPVLDAAQHGLGGAR